MPRSRSRRDLARLAAVALLCLVAAAPSARAAFTTINFDTTPVLGLAPTTFTNPAQAVTVAGLASVSGGTLISTPTNLASFGPGGGARNAYGTRSGTTNGYAQNLSIDFDPGVVVSRVQGTLFNGYVDLNSYTITIFNRMLNPVGSMTFADVEDTSVSTGYRNFDLSANDITRLVITPDTSFSGGAYDYFIDNVGVTYTSVPNAIPEPSSLLATSAGLAGLALSRRRRSRR